MARALIGKIIAGILVQKFRVLAATRARQFKWPLNSCWLSGHVTGTAAGDFLSRFSSWNVSFNTPMDITRPNCDLFSVLAELFEFNVTQWVPGGAIVESTV
jgi:hypothetical protein